MDSLRIALEGINLSGYGHDITLTYMLRIVGIKPRTTRKSDAVDALYAYYTDPDSPGILYGLLSEYEKALLTCIVQNEYRPLSEDMKTIADAHNFKVERSYYSYSRGISEYFPKDSKLILFFVNSTVPPLFKEFLDSTIPPYTRQFHASDVDDPGSYELIEDRELRYRDFDMLVSFVNSNKVAATKSGEYMNKTSLLKFHKTVGYDEVFNGDCYKIEDIRNAGEAIVSFGIIQLMRCADVLDIVKETFVLSKNASKYASMTMPEKAKFLFTSYINHRNSIIDECARIIAPKLKFSKKSYSLSGPRWELVSYLQECPVGEWIDFRLFSQELRRANHNMFTVVGDVLLRDEYYNQYYDYAGWDDLEHCAISIMLLEYMAVLGAVDVYADYFSHDDYEMRIALEVAYFRITDLGAYLFGITDTYTEKGGANTADTEKGFLVQPNFDVVIPQGRDRMQHELFFDRFADKTTSDDEVSVYKLDFKSMVQALNIGLQIREISSYCESFASAAVPDNVKTAFTEWETQSSRIRIRSVTIVETDDAYLLEEIVNYKGMDALSEGRVTPVLVLAPNSGKKVKGLIEKNKRFCINKV